MTISGYRPRGNSIQGFAGNSDVDGLPYTTISYGNGIGYKHPWSNGERYDLTNILYLKAQEHGKVKERRRRASQSSARKKRMTCLLRPMSYKLKGYLHSIRHDNREKRPVSCPQNSPG
ncbi:unnamed protein product [Orchesella dallaii]|uniref:Uncharacterized protein n=1 Tax=Orchesella dallaii TaxID=48710 RepID=A0ABP1QCU1_9HEXA